MDELDIEEFKHGGVNITGFNLLDMTQPKTMALQKEWSKLNPNYWHGAGNGRKVTVSCSLLPKILFPTNLRGIYSKQTKKDFLRKFQNVAYIIFCYHLGVYVCMHVCMDACSWMHARACLRVCVCLIAGP